MHLSVATNTFTSISLFLLRKILLLCLIFSLSACSNLISQETGKQSQTSSLSSFLYPEKQKKIERTNKVPHLSLPVKIGIAFLPSQNWRGSSIDTSTEYQLLNKVKSSFSKYRFIDEIKVIPSTYLRHQKVKNGTGFDTLDQVANLHDVDVIALVSYDQLTQSLHNNASLLYWTIVGMYVIPGNESTVQTFVDTAIFDVRSRKLLMRAPGISKLQKRSTAVDIDRVIRDKSLQGFNLAFEDMIVNLDTELTRFKEEVKTGNTIKVANLNAYSGSGSFNYLALLILSSLVMFRVNRGLIKKLNIYEI